MCDGLKHILKWTVWYWMHYQYVAAGEQ